MATKLTQLRGFRYGPMMAQGSLGMVGVDVKEVYKFPVEIVFVDSTWLLVI